MISRLLDHVDAGALVPIVVAKDGALLLKTCANVVGGAALVIPKMAADVNTSVVASLVAENEVLLLEPANADVEGLVPSAVLVKSSLPPSRAQRGQYLIRLRCLRRRHMLSRSLLRAQGCQNSLRPLHLGGLMWEKTSCPIRLGRRCGLRQVLLLL